MYLLPGSCLLKLMHMNLKQSHSCEANSCEEIASGPDKNMLLYLFLYKIQEFQDYSWLVKKLKRNKKQLKFKLLKINTPKCKMLVSFCYC